MSQFVHLHLHTQYSVLDGAIRIKDLIGRAKEYGQEAVAITDHGVMHGAVEFYEAARAEQIKPIIGCEVYITGGSRHEKKAKSQGGAPTYHLTLLAQNRAGYHNLCRLVTRGFTEGFYVKPRIDFEILSQMSEGLICLSGCVSSEFSSYAKNHDREGGKRHAERYRDIFGDRYYLEVQPHAFDEQRQLNALAADIAKELSIPLVATNDAHYLCSGDTYAHEVLMCVSTGKLITDPDRLQHTGAILHVKNYEEMLEGLPSFDEAIKESVRVAQRCELSFDFNTYYMPRFDPPAERTLEDHFAHEAREGLKRRFSEAGAFPDGLTEPIEKRYLERLDLEIELILKMGFAGYFLVVSDFILWAKNNGVPVGPGRGSAAGSLVAWAMYITEVDPIRHNLLFERFLNPERVSLPDIDIDFCIYGRDAVIRYVREKYGHDRVAQICTFGTLKAKAAIKDVGRVLGLSYAETDKIAKLIPAPRQGFDYPIAEAIKMESRLRDYAEGEGKELIELAMKLEGLSRHTSTHAAGIVIADRKVEELLPLMLDKDEQVVTQFSMGAVEKMGLVKFDFLGLKTLTVLYEAVRMIREDLGLEVSLNELPLDDAATYQLISSGKTIGVFQLESSGITDMVSRLKPTCFEDLVAILALYRPGPLDAGMADHFINRKHGREPVKYAHQILQPILKDTYGIILYQEQIMQIAQYMGGYSLGEADLLRRAMGKKKPQEMAKHREIFVKGAKKNGVAEALASEVFDQMETFARYGFNRSHSVAYALISYQTAYLKTHYARQFMAALMTLEMGDTDKTLKNLNECRELGIKVLPPNVNVGKAGFNVQGDMLIFGLAAIKGIGEKVVDEIIKERDQNGPFQSILDFHQRVESGVLNRRTLEQFAKAGAFDWSEIPRAHLFEKLEEMLKRSESVRKEKNSAQMGLFGSASAEMDERQFLGNQIVPEWPLNVKLAHEKEALGFYLSGHPLERYRKELQRMGAASIADIDRQRNGAEIRLGGVITFLRLKNTKKGDRYATFVLEDQLGTIEVIIWPDVYQKVYNTLVADGPVLVSGKLDVTDERSLVIANTVESAIELRDKSAKEAVVVVESDRCSNGKLTELRSLFAEHKGQCPVKLIVRAPSHSETIISLPPELRIEPSETLCNRVEQLFGSPVMTFRS